MVLLVTAIDGEVDSRGVIQAGMALTSELANEPTVGDATSYWSRNGTQTLRSTDGSMALVVAHLTGSVTQARTALAELSPKYTRDNELIRIEVGGQDEIFRQAATLARQDFVRSGAITPCS